MGRKYNDKTNCATRGDLLMCMAKKRLLNLLIFILLTAIEVLIALFVHDNFVRPFVGDVIVVAVIYYFIRIFFPVGIKYLPVYIFVFSLVVEFMQLFGITQMVSFGNKFLSVLLGNSFSVWDIFCYAVGCIITDIIEKQRVVVKI